MKKKYLKPTTTVIRIEIQSQLLSASSGVNAVDGNTDITYGGGSNQAARVKANTIDWDEWE